MLYTQLVLVQNIRNNNRGVFALKKKNHSLNLTKSNKCNQHGISIEKCSVPVKIV